MAITVTDQPYEFTPAGQKLIIIASSDNSSESGFRFKVVVNDEADVIYTGYIKPNPNNYLVFDIRSVINLTNDILSDGTPIHSIIDLAVEVSGVEGIEVNIYEAWVIDGVLTDDPDEVGATDVFLDVWNATYQPSDGYRPDPSTRYALNSTTKNWLTDRRWDTHRKDTVTSQATTKVLIPVRETDWGILSIKRGLTGDVAAWVVVTIFDTGGAPHSFTIDLGAGEPELHLPVYPANLNASAFDEKPSDYPDWKYIQIKAVEIDETTLASVNYYLYNVAVYGEQDCIHDPVRIGWKNYAGGWDYFNFTKRNEPSISVDRKRFDKILGNYGEVDGSTDFNFTKQDSGLTELKPIVQKYLTVNSDWIQENEFVFLESLIVSQQIHWIQDDGTFTPVVLEVNDYVEARERNGKLKNLSLKFRLSNPVWV